MSYGGAGVLYPPAPPDNGGLLGGLIPSPEDLKRLRDKFFDK